ncbi:MAG: delta-60 repeat domain-containing protein [Gallionellaceae bacterium]|nr:delta-60 repeat domain-containing protein [Gallionellaceae bacterium]
MYQHIKGISLLMVFGVLCSLFLVPGAMAGKGSPPPGSGSLDVSFDSDGKVVTDFGTTVESVTAVAIQADGKIVAAGYASTGTGNSTNFAVARYLANGALDTSFGVGGKVSTPIFNSNNFSNVGDMVIQADGKIILAGYVTVGSSADAGGSSIWNQDFALVRYNTDGSLDSAFGSGGIVTTSLSPNEDVIQYIELQADGRIVVTGYTVLYTNCNWGCSSASNAVLARYNTNGSRDSNFGSQGSVIITDGALNGLAIQSSDGKIVVAGTVLNASVYTPVLRRFNTNGALDSTFGSNGLAAIPNQASTYTAIQGDGKIVVAGKTFDLARFNSNGTLDTTFGSNGAVSTSVFGSEGSSNALALDGSDRIVLAGRKTYAPVCGRRGCTAVYDTFALARYSSNGAVDTTFGSSGKVTTDIGVLNDEARGLAIQADGKIVAGGLANNGTDINYDRRDDFGLARYLP